MTWAQLLREIERKVSLRDADMKVIVELPGGKNVTIVELFRYSDGSIVLKPPKESS